MLFKVMFLSYLLFTTATEVSVKLLLLFNSYDPNNLFWSKSVNSGVFSVFFPKAGF